VNERPLLRDLSLECAAGEFLALVGANGSGKTTLLRAIMGIVPFSGSMLIHGRSRAAISPRESARLMAYLPQQVDLPQGLTAGEFIDSGRHPWRGPFARTVEGDRAAVTEAIERTGTAPFLSERIETLSGGERQRVYIAAALAQRAEILLLDEPTTALDPYQREELWRLLHAVHVELRRTIIMSTHELDGVRAIADRFIALRHGEIIFAGAPHEFFSGSCMIDTYATAAACAERGAR
jgi:iron complex transport system ATP-binding protein